MISTIQNFWRKGSFCILWRNTPQASAGRTWIANSLTREVVFDTLYAPSPASLQRATSSFSTLDSTAAIAV
jgi:hypothetical protein